ncbi:hypothetical protein RW092_12720 [Paenibacillus sp. 3LSP]|uniref:hypothetical protein n=1 Tax=Paenibacillus sp. 3LSP TaxID=2800795 RepID=UPI0028FD39B0|nr:hypothetical protein [Paenibacillus sp. 3LSP]MDU0331049.1 hypothetical protein [Paenibacillus sp. 3LSP]
MAKIKVADFYYGAVLSMLFNKHINPALLESNDDRQIYDLTTNKGDLRLFIKYRADRQKTKTPDYYSWLFTLTESDIQEIISYLDAGHNLVVALVCGVAGLSESEIALLNKDEIKQIIDLQKSSITISRRKNERAFRIAVGGGRDNSIQVKTNRFDELIVS